MVKSDGWGGGMVSIIHQCVNSANIHNNCDNQHNQVIVIIVLPLLYSFNENIQLFWSKYSETDIINYALCLASETLAWRHPHFFLALKPN